MEPALGQFKKNINRYKICNIYYLNIKVLLNKIMFISYKIANYIIITYFSSKCTYKNNYN